MFSQEGTNLTFSQNRFNFNQNLLEGIESPRFNEERIK